MARQKCIYFKLIWGAGSLGGPLRCLREYCEGGMLLKKFQFGKFYTKETPYYLNIYRKFPKLVYGNNFYSDNTNYRVLYQIKQRIPPIMAIIIS